jgi:S-adenosylmethionine:tRNA ribosyltransferase-isomerase
MVAMRVSDFDYELPKHLIAQFPPTERGKSRLLVLNRQSGHINHRQYSDLIDNLEAGDVVVLNNTKVIKARLLAQNDKGQSRELLLLEQHGKAKDHHKWRCLYRGKINAGETLLVGNTPIVVTGIHDGGTADIKSSRDLYELAETAGSVPLPPYMKRNATKDDISRYQTIFAQAQGSVAAPTASLNFTDELHRQLEAKGVQVAYLTLHVGLGTFLPIRTDEVESHKMHSEYFEIPKSSVEVIQKAKQNGNKITALGTTVARTLEYASQQILQDQPVNLSGEADIFIYPGYQFKAVDQLLTNFHAPKSTVLMLAAAFAGWENLRHAYAEAVKENYAFLSYGDSTLII